MKLTDEALQILEILENDFKSSYKSIALQLNITEARVQELIKELEENRIIVSYPTLIDWTKVDGQETVEAMIDVKVTPERGVGFDEVAERIYRYPEVKSLYLMSGTYDLSVTLEGKTMRDIALFVSRKLATIEGVLSTTTHFKLKQYKHDGVIIEGNEDTDRRMVVSP
jgi:DNA-binding Lrp family transcriptional regulator